MGASCKIGATKRTSEDADEDSLNECNLSTHNLIDDMEYSIHLLAHKVVLNLLLGQTIQVNVLSSCIKAQVGCDKSISWLW